MNADENNAVAPGAQPSPNQRSRAKRWGWLLAKICVAGAAFFYVLTRQSFSELGAAIQQITAGSVAAAIAIQFVCLTLSAGRWRILMVAYGARDLPHFWELLRSYFVGHFYNIYLPGAVGGDVLRGVVARRSFPDGGATASIAIILVERLLGLLTVFVLTALAAPFDAKGELARKVFPYALFGIASVIAVIVGLTHGQRIAPYMPGRVAVFVRNLPSLARPRLFPVAVLLSFVVQGLFIVCIHVLVIAIHPQVAWTHSLVVVPLMAIASYFPLSVAGAGPRDAVMVALYALGGVPRAEALAASLTLLVVSLLVAATGGVWQLLAPAAVRSASPEAAP